MLKTINTNNTIFQIIAAEVESQQTQNTTPVAQQEVTPKTPKIQNTKTPKTPKISTISTTFKSFTTQHGFYIPSQNKTNITHISYNTTLSINSITRGYTLECKINGEQQVSVDGDVCYTNWMLRVHAGDIVEVTVIGGKSTKNITYTINQDGVTASASEDIKHTLKGTHKSDLDIQDKYRKQASQQTVEAPAPAQVEEISAPAQAEETTVEAAQDGQTINFGKHAGKVLSSLDSDYLKWLVAHESRLAQANRWACTAAKVELERRAQQEQTMQTTSTINKIATRKSRVSSSIASLVAAKVAQAESIIATGEFSKSVEQTIERKLGLPAEADLGLLGHLNTSKGFQMWR